LQARLEKHEEARIFKPAPEPLDVLDCKADAEAIGWALEQALFIIG